MMDGCGILLPREFAYFYSPISVLQLLVVDGMQTVVEDGLPLVFPYTSQFCQ